MLILHDSNYLSCYLHKNNVYHTYIDSLTVITTLEEIQHLVYSIVVIKSGS